MKKYSKSELWKLNLDNNFSNFNIDTFRDNRGSNNKLGTWHPIENSSRYFKSLLYKFAEELDLYEINKHSKEIQSNSLRGKGLSSFLGKLNGTELGNPITVSYYDLKVSIDYLLSVEEIIFLGDTLKTSESILEIGAGFGRLPHVILENFPNVNKYVICDLPEMLSISELFLRKVLSKDLYNKVIFIENYNYPNVGNIDLSINIDSFQEIDGKIVLDYLNGISKNSSYFFSKNAICKYDPQVINVNLDNKDQLNAALKQGLCLQKIDIFNSRELEIARSNYLMSYQPDNFSLIKDKPGYGQYLFYHSALYKKE